MNVTGTCGAIGKGTGTKVLGGENLSVFGGRGGREVSGIASHDFVENEHAGVGRTFVDNVFKELGSLDGRRVGAKRLFDRVNVIVNGLWKERLKIIVVTTRP